jgi:tetratricopeptide (TPR) repeat protein
MVYAQLQLGRDQAARRVIDEFKSADGAKIAQFAGPYAAVAMPARLALERGDWAAAAQLPMQGSAFAHCEAITSFSRALGSARLGNVVAAEQDASRLEAQHKALAEAKNNYWATEVEIQRIAVAAWVAKAKGQADDAVRLMRAAADMEDRNEKHSVTPGRVLPARELLGDLLMELKQPAAALKEYEQSQIREPNRLRGFAGAAAAAEAAGDRAKARQHYAKLMELTREADSPLPEVARAKSFLASNG